MEKITVIFEGGIANDGVHACNYMLARTEDADGDPIELYSEVLMPENLRDDEVDAFDAATYPILKEDIINQAIDAGIDANQLVFPYGEDESTGGRPYDLTYDDLIRKLDEYFPRVKAKQMEIEI